MKKKIVCGGVLVVACASMLVVKGFSQTPQPMPFSQTPSPLPAASSVPVPKPKPNGKVNLPRATYRAPKPGYAPLGQPGQDQTLEQVADRIRLASLYQTEERPVQGETVEELAESLKAVRARQKELQAQEQELLAKIAEKIEDKRKELEQAQEVLHQLRGDSNRPKPASGSRP